MTRPCRGRKGIDEGGSAIATAGNYYVSCLWRPKLQIWWSAGYAGYVPAKLPPTRPTALQAALWEIQNAASLETIGKLLKNVVVNPSEEKFRRIRLTNARIKSLIVDEKSALSSLLALGWEHDSEDKELLVIPKGRYFTMAEVRLIQDAEERLKKLQRDAKRSIAAAKFPADVDQERIRAQMKADRLEHASRTS